MPSAAQTIRSEKPEPSPSQIEKGEPAPFDGILYTTVQALRISLREERCVQRAELDIATARKRHAIEIEAATAAAAIKAEANDARIALLERQLAEANPWHSSPPIVATVAATLTVAAVVLAVVIVHNTQRLGPPDG